MNSGDSILFEGFIEDFTLNKKGKKYIITADMQDKNLDAYSKNSKNEVSTISTKKFIKKWDKFFGDTSAPTAIEYTDEDGKRKTSIFNIDKPSKTKQGIKFKAKLSSKEDRDNMIHEFGNHALKHSDPVTGSFKNGNISIDGTDDDKQMAMDGNMYEVFMPSLDPLVDNDYVMPGSAYGGQRTPLNLHPNKGWMGGMIFTMKNLFAVDVARNNQLVPLANQDGNPNSAVMWNQAWDYVNGEFLTNTYATTSHKQSYPKEFLPPDGPAFPIISYGGGDGKTHPNPDPITLEFESPALG